MFAFLFIRMVTHLQHLVCSSMTNVYSVQPDPFHSIVIEVTVIPILLSMLMCCIKTILMTSSILLYGVALPIAIFEVIKIQFKMKNTYNINEDIGEGDGVYNKLIVRRGHRE